MDGSRSQKKLLRSSQTILSQYSLISISRERIHQSCFVVLRHHIYIHIHIHICIFIYSIHIHMQIPIHVHIHIQSTYTTYTYLVGGFNHLETYISQLGWLFPKYGHIKIMFETTNQIHIHIFHIYLYMYSSSSNSSHDPNDLVAAAEEQHWLQ
jgi:hypothetical protein